MELKKLLARTGQSIKEFAIKVGVTEDTAISWFSEKRKPNINKYKRIADALGVDTDLIFNLYENRKTK